MSIFCFDLSQLLAELIRDEGKRLKPYADIVGKITIGVGRNLTDVGISDDECNALLTHDVDRTVAWLDQALPWWRNLDPIRQRALVNMAFNLGSRLLDFTDTLTALQHENYAAAASAMLDSKWAVQVGARAQRLASLIRTGAI